MAKIFEDNSRSIGNTPLVKLNRVTAGIGATVLAKSRAQSLLLGQVRVGAAMIWDAERKDPPPGRQVTIVEPTSGNTGIALAFVASRGYPHC